MNSLTRSSLLSRTTSARSQLRRSLPSIYAGVSSTSACNDSTCCSPGMDQQRFLQTTTATTNMINLMSTSTSSSSLASARTMSANNSSLLSPYHRSFHGTPRQLEDAAAAPEEEEADSSSDEPHPTEIEYEFTPPPPLSEESIGKVNGLFEQILHLDMIEVHLLTMVVNEQLGIKWNQVQAAGAGPIGGAAAAAPAEEVAEEKLLKDLKLVGFDAKAKIKVIKEVRSIAGLGLKEAKEMVEGAPKIIQKELKPEKAEELKAQLEAVGAQIEIC